MEKRENFYRFSALLLHVGARVLREVLTFHHLGPNTLAAYLSSNKCRLMKLPVNVMRQDKLDILFPPSGNNALIENFDITLMCILFRNLDSSKSSNNRVWSTPSATDLSFQADVGRIQVTRNSMSGLVSSASMDTSTFNIEASNLTTIYLRLISPLQASQFSASDLQQMIDKELKGPLQQDVENEINRMRRKLHEWQRYDEDVKQMVKEVKTDIQEILNVQRGSTLMDEKLQSGAATTRKQEELSDTTSKFEEKLLEKKKQLDSLNSDKEGGRTFINKVKQQRIICTN